MAAEAQSPPESNTLPAIMDAACSRWAGQRALSWEATVVYAGLGEAAADPLSAIYYHGSA